MNTELRQNSGPRDFIAWARAIRNGNESAFEGFFDDYRDTVHSYAMWLTNADRHLSEELLQHTMIQAARRFPKVDTPEKLLAWLKRVMRNRLCDLIRKHKTDPLALLNVEIDLDTRSTSSAEPISAARRLFQALQTLPEDERALIDAIYTQCQSHAQVSAALESTPKAIESRLARIRKKLKLILIKEMRDEI